MNSEKQIRGRHFDHPDRPRGFGGNRLRRHPELLKALHAEWRKLSPMLTAPNEEMSEREMRIWYANQKLHARRLDRGIPDLASWSELTPNEARHLLTCMREESGDGPAYRAMLIARMAQDLFGTAWDRLLQDRLRARFMKFKAEDLTPAEAHAEMEELLSRIARRDGIEIEEARGRFSGRKL